MKNVSRHLQECDTGLTHAGDMQAERAERRDRTGGHEHGRWFGRNLPSAADVETQEVRLHLALCLPPHCVKRCDLSLVWVSAVHLPCLSAGVPREHSDRGAGGGSYLRGTMGS